MRCFPFVIIPIILCAAVGNGKPLKTSSFATKIVNGTDANDGQFPFVVSLRYVGDGHVCGASIISPSWVLTAAQCCLTGYPLDVYVGSVYLSKGGKVYPIRKYVIHKDYSPIQFQKNDICLINVGVPIEYNGNVGPISLPHKDFNIPQNSTLTLLGWGDTNPSDGYDTSDRLQVLKSQKLLTNSECSSKTDIEIFDGQLCAAAEDHSGACGGDSGSPLVLNGVQVGLSSWEYAPCGGTALPDVFTRITFYVDWIIEAISSSEP